MILLCGIPSESPLAMVAAALERRHVPVVWFNQRRADEMQLDLRVNGGGVGGELRVGRKRHSLAAFSGVYNRLMDDQQLPELKGEPEGSPRRLRVHELHAILYRWTEITPARVVNRVSAMGSNFSKPYQAQLIRASGFSTPDTLITNDPERVREFHRKHERVIYKSISGVRSIVQTLSDDDLDRLEHIRWCPTQFQEHVPGDDVRVHVVGEQVFATRVASTATDYRYASREGSEAELSPFELDDDVAERCVGLAAALGLAFAGIDLRMAPDGRVVCFEVNPSPAFSYYESHTGQGIAEAVGGWLGGESGGDGCVLD